MAELTSDASAQLEEILAKHGFDRPFDDAIDLIVFAVRDSVVDDEMILENQWIVRAKHLNRAAARAIRLHARKNLRVGQLARELDLIAANIGECLEDGGLSVAVFFGLHINRVREAKRIGDDPEAVMNLYPPEMTKTTDVEHQGWRPLANSTPFVINPDKVIDADDQRPLTTEFFPHECATKAEQLGLLHLYAYAFRKDHPLFCKPPHRPQDLVAQQLFARLATAYECATGKTVSRNNDAFMRYAQDVCTLFDIEDLHLNYHAKRWAEGKNAFRGEVPV